MDFQYTERMQSLIEKAKLFIEKEIEPRVPEYMEQLAEDPWGSPAVMEELKEKAKAEGLWNLFLPPAYEGYSPGLTNLEYAPIRSEERRVGKECRSRWWRDDVSRRKKQPRGAPAWRRQAAWVDR